MALLTGADISAPVRREGDFAFEHGLKFAP